MKTINKNIIYTLINDEWIQQDREQFIEQYNVNKQSLTNALNSKQGFGRIRLQDKNVVIVSYQPIQIKSIDEQIKDFGKWWGNYRKVFMLRFTKRNPKIRVEDLEDIVSDAMVYVVEQLQLGKGVNNYVSLMLLKANGLLLDRMKTRGYVGVTYYDINEDPNKPEEYYNTVTSRQQLECFDSYHVDECDDVEVNITDSREYSLFDNEFTLEETLINNVNHDVRSRVIRYVVISLGYSESEYDIWYQCKISQLENKTPMTKIYDTIKTNLNGITLRQFRNLIQRIDKLLEVNTDKIKELYDSFKYKTFEDENLIC